MKQVLKNILCILLSIILLFILTGCKDKEENGSLEEKIKSEIEYLDSKIVGMLNKLNNISYQNYKITTEKIELNESSGQEGEQSSSTQKGTESNTSSGGETSQNKTINQSEMDHSSILGDNTQNINWTEIKSDIELLHDTWSTIIIDLTQRGINNKYMEEFSKLLDNTTVDIKEENKKESLIGLTDMYSYLTKFLENEGDNIQKNIKNVKMHIIKAYSLVESENWEQMGTEVNEAIRYYNNIINQTNYVKENSFKVEKTSISLKELQNSLTVKDKNVFYIKYRNLMEQLSSF